MENDKENNQLQLIDDIKTIASDTSVLPVPMAKTEAEGLLGLMAKDADHPVLRLTVKVAVLKAYINNQRSSKKTELSILIDSLTDEILRIAASIRLEEIGLAIHKTAMGEFGKVYNLSMAFFVEGIRTYMHSEKRIEANKNIMLNHGNQLLLSAPKPSPEQLAKEKLQIVKSAFEFFKNKGFYNDYGNYIFDALGDYGVLNFTEEDVNNFYKEGKARLISYLTRPVDSIRRIENQKVLKEVFQHKDHYLIFIEVKKIALNKFFKDLVEMDTDITDLIEA